MQSPNWSVGSIATIIKTDSGTTTHLLQIANSALYGGTARIGEVDRAVARIGIVNTRNIVTAHALRSMFVTPSQLLAALMRRTWERSARLAAVSAVLAKHISKEPPERAMLAGLLQDIGVLPILNVLKRCHRQLPDEGPVVDAVDRYASAIGTILLTHWGFEPEMVEVARSRGDWFRDPGPKPDLADLVLVARLHTGGVWGGDRDPPDPRQVPAFAKLPVRELRDDSSLQILRDEEQAIREILLVPGVEH
jgi:HD-like signal output (HDOD) protein